MNILNEIQEIFRDFFDDETLIITESTRSEDIEDWDSLAQMNLIVAMEKHFKMKFKIDEIIELKKVGDMAALIKERI